MVKRGKPETKTIQRREANFIDGWGLIFLVIGIALFLLREDIRWVGVVVFLIGFSRILYILNKYGW